MNDYWREGADAHDAGISNGQNPYTPDSYPWRCWDNGWHDAWYEFNFNYKREKGE